jgi:diadenosine tetraphosphate (Ap4A) HIT family hydrolase
MPAEMTKSSGLNSRIVDESESFFVIPSVAPLVEGHLLIVPKRHITSLAQLPLAEKDELTTLTTNVCDRVRDLWSASVFFEHGIGRGKAGGCGVQHAHMHVVPASTSAQSHFFESLERQLNGMSEPGTLGDALRHLGLDNSYLLVGTSIAKVRFYASETIPSQFVRQLLVGPLSSKASDWRVLSGWKEFAATYVRFSESRRVSDLSYADRQS